MFYILPDHDGKSQMDIFNVIYLIDVRAHAPAVALYAAGTLGFDGKIVYYSDTFGCSDLSQSQCHIKRILSVIAVFRSSIDCGLPRSVEVVLV